MDKKHETPEPAATRSGVTAEHRQPQCIERDVFVQFLETLHGGCEGRADFRFLPSRVQIFTNRRPSEAIHSARRHAHENIYVGVATRRDDSSGDLTNCLHLPALFTDIDFKIASETDVRRLLAEFPCPASMLVQSGNGVHAYWLLDEPIDLTDGDTRTTAKTILRRLACHFQGDLAAAEPARILRIPGGWNHKYFPPRPVRLERCDETQLYRLDQLDDVLPPEPDTHRFGPSFRVEVNIAEGGRNTHLYKLARSLKTKGLVESEILAAVSTVNARRCHPPLPGTEVATLVTHAYEQLDRQGERTPDPAGLGPAAAREVITGAMEGESLASTLVDYRELLTMTLPERRTLLPWLREGGLVMVFGTRGHGKTMFGLGVAASLVSGKDFLCWSVTAPTGVLYVDGEMPLDELRRRTTDLLTGPPKAPLYFLSGEIIYSRLERDLTLADPASREAVTAILDARKDLRVVILDNVSCLFPGLDEDRKRDWEPIAAWLVSLRRRGLAVILVHHAGKGGQQRGTSGREDALDVTIQLARPSGYDPREGLHFTLEFTKARSVKGEAVQTLDVRLDDSHNWIWKPIEVSLAERARALFSEGVTGTIELAEELGITKGYASKLIKKLKAEP